MFSLSATQRGVVVAPTTTTLKTTKRSSSSSARRASKLHAKEAEADADAEATDGDDSDASSSSEEETPKDRGIFKMFAPDGEVNASDYNKFKAKEEARKKREELERDDTEL